MWNFSNECQGHFVETFFQELEMFLEDIMKDFLEEFLDNFLEDTPKEVLE